MTSVEDDKKVFALFFESIIPKSLSATTIKLSDTNYLQTVCFTGI